MPHPAASAPGSEFPELTRAAAVSPCRNTFDLPPPPRRQVPSARPLTGAVTIRRCPVPDPAPPYDDQSGPANPAGGAGLAARWGLAVRRSADAADVRPRGAGRPEPGTPSPSRPGPAGPAAADPWPGRFAQVLAEALAGTRPAQQVVPWTTRQTRRRISELGQMLSVTQLPRLRRVVVCCPSPDVIELTAIVMVGSRVRAVAARLERAGPAPDLLGPLLGRTGPGSQRGERRPRWLCTAIEAA